MTMLASAPPDVVKRVNQSPPGARSFLTRDNVNSLRKFGAGVHGLNRIYFAHTRPTASPPEEGKTLNPDPHQIRMAGPVPLLPRWGALSTRLRKRMRKDPQIALGLSAIKAPIMAAFDSIKVNCKDPIIRGFVQHSLMNMHGGLLRRAVYSALRSLEFGFINHEKVWQNGVDVEFEIKDSDDGSSRAIKMSNSTILEDVCDLDPEYTEVLVDGKTGVYTGLRYAYDQTLKAEKTWLVTHDKEFGHLLGTAVIDNSHNAWYWCDIMYLFCNRYYERKASPPIKGRAPAVVEDNNGEPIPGVDLFGQMLESLISEGVIVLPSELNEGQTGQKGQFAWDCEYMIDDKRGEMFIRYIEHLQTLKLRGILLPEMVVERGADAGTFGMAKAHTDTFVEMLTLILEEVLQHINRWLIPDLVMHNFGPNAPPCTIETLVKIGERKDLLEEILLEVIKAEGKAGVVDAARLVDLITLMRQLNIDTTEKRPIPQIDDKMEQDEKLAKIEEKVAKVKLKGEKVTVETQEEQLKQTKIQTPVQRKQAKAAKKEAEFQEQEAEQMIEGTHPDQIVQKQQIVGQQQQLKANQQTPAGSNQQTASSKSKEEGTATSKAKNFIPFIGPKGGKGFRNTETGDITFQKTKPTQDRQAGLSADQRIERIETILLDLCEKLAEGDDSNTV